MLTVYAAGDRRAKSRMSTKSTPGDALRNFKSIATKNCERFVFNNLPFLFIQLLISSRHTDC